MSQTTIERRPGWESVIVAASGPSFSAEQASLMEESTKGTAWKIAVVNNSFIRYPNADLLFASDLAWWRKYHEKVRAAGFAGELWTQNRGAASKYRLGYVASKNTRGLSRDSSVVYHGGSSGHMAINLAFHFGAQRIVLVGFDNQRTGGQAHWHGEHVQGLSRGQAFPAWDAHFVTLAEGLAAEGIEVFNCSISTALTCFRCMALEEVLALNLEEIPA